MRSSALPRSLRGSLVRPLALILSFTLLTSCGGSKKSTDYGSGLNAMLSDLRRSAQPIADVYSGPFLDATGSGRSDEDILHGIKSNNVAAVDHFNSATCSELQQTAKSTSAPKRDNGIEGLRQAAQAAVADSFIASLVNNALRAPSDKRDSLLRDLGIATVKSGGAKTEGVAALQAAKLLTPQGDFQIPPYGSSEYVSYSDWLSNDPSFRGLVRKMTSDLDQAIQTCPLT
jgi:hypothetical protein